MRLIDADVLLEKVREIRKLALDRAVETPANMPFPIYQNPAYTRYSTQANEREKFKVMIEEEPTVNASQTRLGEWLDGYKMQTCSLCKCRGKKSWTFCPHCGARMIYGERKES